MTNMQKLKWLVVAAVAATCTLSTTRARAFDNDCLEVGWKDRNGQWTFHRAWVDEYNEHGRMHIKYDWHHGELELKVSEHENAEGEDLLFFRGKWFEGNSDRWGKVLLKKERGRHRATGYYTFRDSEERYDFALRECRGEVQPPPEPQESGRGGGECLEIGWIDPSGQWAYYRASIVSVDNGEFHLRYEYNHGRMDLKVKEHDDEAGRDVYVFHGDWREDHGRAGGKVRLVLEKGRHHARGFYTNGGWEDQHYELKLGDCSHVR
jgi:hypothetical protein